MVDTARLERVPERGASSSLAMGTKYASVTQREECFPYMEKVSGSNPLRCTKR
jgi:hypothetical protein